MKLSIIIPFSSNEELRIKALYKLLECIKVQDWYKRDSYNNPVGKDYEILVVQQTRDGVGPLDLSSYDVINRIIYISHHTINKSWMMNVGARYAEGQYLLFLDADIQFGKEYLDKINRYQRKTNAQFFMAWDKLLKESGRDEPVLREVSRDQTLTAGGAFYIYKELHFACGGMNENYFGYGGEDNDYWARLNLQLNKNIKYFPYTLLHTYHHNAIPNPDRIGILDKTLQYPTLIMQRLKDINVGKKHSPSLIKLEDIQLNAPSITDKDSKGIDR